MENLDTLLLDLSLLCDKADLYYPDRDNRPEILRYFMDSLHATETEHDQLAHLKGIRDFLIGGQGSFHDIALNPPPELHVSGAEADREVADLRSKIITKIDDVVGRHPEADAIPLPKFSSTNYAKLLYTENRSVLPGNNNASIGNKPEILANLEKQYLKDRIPVIIALMGLEIGCAMMFAVLYVLTTPLEVMMNSGHAHPILNVVGFTMPGLVIFITGALLFYRGYYGLRLAFSRDRAQLLYDRLIKHGKVETGDALSINHINGEYEINYSFLSRGMFGGRPRVSCVYITSQPPPFKALNTIAVLYTTHLSVIL